MATRRTPAPAVIRAPTALAALIPLMLLTVAVLPAPPEPPVGAAPASRDRPAAPLAAASTACSARSLQEGARRCPSLPPKKGACLPRSRGGAFRSVPGPLLRLERPPAP